MFLLESSILFILRDSHPVRRVMFPMVLDGIQYLFIPIKDIDR